MKNMMDGQSLDMEQEARERLESAFPDCFSEGKLDIDKLLNLCGEYIDRLRLAANLLRDDGVCFISIDDNEIDNQKKLCNEVLGEENFVAQIVWQKKYAVPNDDPGIAAMHEYNVVYQKSDAFKRNLLPRTEKQLQRYTNLDNDPRGVWSSDNYISNKSRWERPTLWYPIKHPKTGKDVWPDENAVWRYSQENHEQMAKETAKLLGKKVFSTPKPLRLLKQILILATNKNEDNIILDFFAGSSASAHAVMQLNAEDGGNRRFVCVQLPEVCDEKSEVFKAGYKNICEIGKERIRRAGAKLLESNGQMALGEDKPPLDTGFKVFKLDTSNLKTWDGTPVGEEDLPTLFGRLNGMIDRIKPDRTDLDMVYEVMLKLGVPLTFPVLPVEISPGGKRAYSIGEDALLLVCLVEGISSEDVEAVADYAPAKIILAKSSLADDTAMSNAYYILRDRGIELKLV